MSFVKIFRTSDWQKSNIHTKQKSIEKIDILMKKIFIIYTKR